MWNKWQVEKKGFLKNASFGLLSQLQNASVTHLIAFYGATLSCPHGHDEALEEFCKKLTSEELA